MPSALGWIDYDAQHHESMKRMLLLFRERESRDELGLGAIRDSIADKLFPGTSTLHTRLRYMLFVPWLYQRLEEQRVSADHVERKARNAELELIEPLLATSSEGVIGARARGELKRLPSENYWAGLASWGILRFAGSQRDYHRAFDRLAERRSSGRRRQDLDVPDETALTWHESLPLPPDDFPHHASFDLTRDEADYLRERVQDRHPGSLLAFLAQANWDVPEVEYIWSHPRLGSFRDAHQALVARAQIFSEVMHGAALLYNLELARLRGSEEMVADFEALLDAWLNTMRPQAERAAAFDFDAFWSAVKADDHAVSPFTRTFVTQWFELARMPTRLNVDAERARRLVREREQSLKHAQSRFVNRVALDQWAGWSGTRLLNYRWPNAARFLRDMRAGLAQGDR